MTHTMMFFSDADFKQNKKIQPAPYFSTSPWENENKVRFGMLTSSGYIFSPPLLIRSLARPISQRLPQSSVCPMSPVSSQPGSELLDGISSQYRSITWGPLVNILPTFKESSTLTLTSICGAGLPTQTPPGQLKLDFLASNNWW